MMKVSYNIITATTAAILEIAISFIEYLCDVY